MSSFRFEVPVAKKHHDLVVGDDTLVIVDEGGEEEEGRLVLAESGSDSLPSEVLHHSTKVRLPIQ